MLITILTSKDKVFVIDVISKGPKIKLDATITGRSFVDFVNENVHTIEVTENITKVYNELWADEEQFQPRKLGLTSNVKKLKV
jgi:hypothetical protein